MKSRKSMSGNGRRRTTRVFTLIEIMVALGALMLMMSFLFEFVIGSQRIWRASEHTAGTFDDAETVLSFVGDDFRSMRYSNQIGSTRPFILVSHPTTVKYKDGTNSYALPSASLSAWVFYSQFKDSQDTKAKGVYPVVYLYLGDTDDYEASDETEQKIVRKLSRTLFRVTLVKDGDAGIADISVFDDVTQLDLTSELTVSENTAKCALFLAKLTNFEVDEDDILMQDVMRFGLDIIPPDGVTAAKGTDATYLFRQLLSKPVVWAVRCQPRGVQLKVSISPKDAVSADAWEEAADADARKELLERNERSFTKTITLDTN